MSPDASEEVDVLGEFQIGMELCLAVQSDHSDKQNMGTYGTEYDQIIQTLVLTHASVRGESLVMK